MKYLIYELFSGVGFCNQLFSLETAIYLANITNRKLILLVRNPLCHCGRSSWDYGHFLDFFSDDYKQYLPHGIEVYYKMIPEDITNIINDNKKCYTPELSDRFSNLVMIEEDIKNRSDDNEIKNFCNGRNHMIIDFAKMKADYIYVNKSNASRCFYNFYTSQENYYLMSKICFSLTHYNTNIRRQFINLDDDIELSLHLRLGDYHITNDKINANNKCNENYLVELIDKHINNSDSKIILMCDRKNADLLDILKSKYKNLIFSENISRNNDKNPIIDFLIQKNLCEQSKKFIGTYSSTVSNYIDYMFYNDKKEFNLYYNKKIISSESSEIGWVKNKTYGNRISWACFYSDNVKLVKPLTMNEYFYKKDNFYLNIIREINIDKNTNKKVISFCLYGLNDERNKKRHFDKGVYVNYYYMKKYNYKNWIMRVYMPYNEPKEIIDKIISFGDIELVLVDTNICYRALRFLPNDDPNVKVWLSRDLDSIINSREEKAVNDWLQNESDKELMLMSDNQQHTWSVTGGMFGIINNYKKQLVEFIGNFCSNNNVNKFAYDCVIAEQFFFSDNNYIQYYRAGKKLPNSKPFPYLSPIHCNFVGNISPIEKYYTKHELEKNYPFLSNKVSLLEDDKFLYNHWKCFFKNSEPLCSVMWNGDDFVMTVDPKKEMGVGTWKTLNGDGKKLLKLNTHIQILWENKKYLDAYMPDKDTISVKHGDIWYNFYKVEKYNSVEKIKDNVDENIKCFSKLWKGGFRSGYNNRQNQTLLENYVKKNMKGKTCLEIGCGGGQWSKFIYDLNIFDKIYCIDALSEEHNCFWNYVGHEKKDKIIYIQVSDFSLSFIPENSLDYVFSYDVFCHICYSGQNLYLKNLYGKCKNNCELLIMYADPDKYKINCPEKFRVFELEQKRKGKTFKNYDELREILFDDCHNNSPNWCFIGMERFLNLCKKYNYTIIDNDINLDNSSPITKFKKEDITLDTLIEDHSNIIQSIKNIVIYSNCQGIGIRYFLKKFFTKSEIDIIDNYKLIWNKGEINKELLKKADLFIYQPINKTHGIYSTSLDVENNIMSYLKPNCVKIAFPYIYNDSLWILIPPAKIDNFIGNFNKLNKYVNTLPIQKLKSEGKSLTDVLEMYKKELIDFNFTERYNNCINILKKKEALCDVKISSYIEENIREKKLFLTQNHPTACVIINCVNQIFSLLKIDFKLNSHDFNDKIPGIPDIFLPHTEYEKKFLNFKYELEVENSLDNSYYLEHIKNIYNNSKNIYNLPYSIPKEVIKPLDFSKKEKEFATVIPGKSSTYIFKPINKINCIKYNNDYEISKYALTYKKGGWDCLRHYEILANNCLPLFLDINNCPEHTMYNFPKKLCSDILHDYNNKNLNDNKYKYYLKELHNYTKTFLTCEKQAENIMKILYLNKKINNPKVLLLHSNSINYSLATICIGLRNLLKNQFIDYPKYDVVYDKSDKYIYNISVLDDNYELDRSDIVEKINNKYFDFVIIGSLGIDEGRSNKIYDSYQGLKQYNSDELVFIFGGDRPFNLRLSNKNTDFLEYYAEKGICFIRELNYTTDEYHDESWNLYAKNMRDEWNEKIKMSDNIKNNTF